jgi:hypothetical protein
MLEAAAPTRQQFDEPATSPVVVMRNPIAGPLVSSVTHLLWANSQQDN